MSAAVLRLTIDVPGYYVDDVAHLENADEEVEVGMQLSTEEVGLVFVHTEGDDPQVHVEAMTGQIVKYEVVSPTRSAES